MQERRQPEVIAGRVNADGSIATGDGFTVVKTGTGAYGVYFPTGFRLVSIAATIVPGGGAFVPTVGSFVGSALTVSTFNSAGTAVDGAFSFVAVGVQV